MNKTIPNSLEGVCLYLAWRQQRISILRRGDNIIDFIMASKGVKDKPIILPQTKVPTQRDRCTHCNKKRYIHDMCFKLFGYLAW